MAPSPARHSALFTPILIAGCLVLLLNFALRAAFGVFQIPIGTDMNWARSEFSMAIAIQNLAWGIGQPLFSALAERFGDRKAMIAGTILYAAGLVLTALSTAPWMIQGAGWIVGFGIAGTGFGVILAIIGRAARPEHRSLALGIGTAAGSAGQVFGPPLAEILLQSYSWQGVFLIFAALILLLFLALPFLASPAAGPKLAREESLGAVLNRALRDPSYMLIFLGFFSCGYQLGFITAHFPAFVTELCGPIDAGGFLAGMGISSLSRLGALSIAVIGITNIAGTILAGYLGNYYSKKNLLALIYLGRTLASIAFIMTDITPTSVLLFSAVMGSLWLATVPLTSGLVAQIWGLRYMGTLYGVIFFSHQIGSFMGVWLGGEMYDLYQNYTLVWWIGIGVGAFSALVHLPIRERPAALRMA